MYFAQVITSQARQFAPCSRRQLSLRFVLQSSNRIQQASFGLLLPKGPLLQPVHMDCSAANLLSFLRFLPDQNYLILHQQYSAVIFNPFLCTQCKRIPTNKHQQTKFSVPASGTSPQLVIKTVAMVEPSGLPKRCNSDEQCTVHMSSAYFVGNLST